MSNQRQNEEREISDEELEEQQAAELPDREAMSLINANIAIPVNAAVAANVLSDNAAAVAQAAQNAGIGQGMGGQPPVPGDGGIDPPTTGG